MLVAAGDIISYMPAAKATHSSNALGGTLGTLKVSHIFVRKEINPYLVIRASVLVILQISIVGTLSTLVTSGDITSEILLVRASMLVILQISIGSSISPTFHGISRRG